MADGDPLRVTSRRGSVLIGVRISDRQARGQVFIPMHYREAAANLLTNPALDPYAKIAEFKAKNMGLLPGDQTYHQHLNQVQGELQRTEAFVNEAVKVRDSLQKQLAEVPQFFESPKSDSASMAMVSSQQFGPESDLNLRIYEMEKNVDALLMRYTDKHPDVIMARKRIAELKAQQKKEEEEKAKIAQQNAAQPVAVPASESNKVPNPLYEQITMGLIMLAAVGLDAFTRRGG